MDDGWYVGRLKEVPGVFSQGESLEKLEENIQEAYKLMVEDDEILPHVEVQTKEIRVEKVKPVRVQQEQQLNQRAYRRLKKKIDQTHLAGQYVAIVRGKVVADAPTFRELIAKLAPIEGDPDRRFVIQAGVEYPEKEIIKKLTRL